MAESDAGIGLRRTSEDRAAVDTLADALGGRVGLAPLLDDLNRRAAWFPAPGSAVQRSLRWNTHDCLDRRWWPQGISSSADAGKSDTVADRRVLAVSWYAKPVDGVHMGSRISFLDLDSLTYRHVLLVVPSLDEGQLTLDPLRVHSGGIVWHGPYLHIAATRRGLFTARVDDLMRMPGDLRDRTSLHANGEHSASYGYRYVLPVCASYAADNDEGVEPMRYSFVSLSRHGDERHLTVGEYGRGAMSRRLAYYPLDRPSHRLVSAGDDRSRPVLLHTEGVGNMQGAVVVDGTWYVTRSRGPWGLGSLCVGEPGAFVEHRRAVPMGPEDVTFWPSTGTLWTATEWPGRRWIVGVDVQRLSGG